MFSREYRTTRFLIVDTQMASRLALEKVLQSFGAWYIEMAVNAEQAIERCRNGVFDVVICDYQLEGRNGQHVLEELRERSILRYTSTFILVSAETTREMVLAAIDHQPDAYITRPIQADILRKRLDSLLVDGEALYDIRHAMDCKRLGEAISRCEDRILRGGKYRRWCEKTVAELYLREENYTEALRVYRTVLDEKALLWARLGLARVYLGTARIQEAEALLKQVVAESPDCLLAADLLAGLYQEEGRLEDAQRLVQAAVDKTPAAIRRQAVLGELSWAIQDIDTATEAYRNAVTLGEHSVYDQADNYLGFARALCEKSASLPRDLRERQAQEALDVMALASERHELDDKACFQGAVLHAKLHQRLREDEAVEVSLKEAEGYYQALGLEVDCDDSLAYAEALLNSDRDLQAEFVLSQVSLLHGDDEAVQKRVAQIREEPVSLGASQRAAELNRQGIKLAEKGELQQAIDVFQDALDYSPRHPGLNLNLVQILLRQIGQSNPGSGWGALAKSCLSRLDKLDSAHPQFARFQHLKRKLDSLA